jgi:hypothetical protein
VVAEQILILGAIKKATALYCIICKTVFHLNIDIKGPLSPDAENRQFRKLK